ncbi:hypothetical protein K492DRAFT_122695, partial [Lichtheimia hyalospora FSU 10163]
MSKVPAINTQVQRQRSSQFTSESAPGPLEQDNLTLHKDTTLYEQEEQDDLDEEEDDDDDSTFTSSPSIPDENINFDLVYALHTFVATVEGQASVFKGDALTLLDDSNSYWWLVSVLKTSEVGYIPAENIETPFERLARLNKHRNVEVTAMDQAVHYIPQATNNTSAAVGNKKRRVTMNKDLNVQVQIILVGDDGEQQVGEAYEEWEESMVTECSDDDDDFESMDEKEQEQDDIGQLAVLRVFAGNVNVGAMYHSMLVDENTSAEQLLIQAMERFHIAQIENKASGGRSSSRTITPTNGSGVEYYLTVKSMNGDEVTLATQDKPLAIFRSMTDQLTTPMPSLAHVKKFSQQFASTSTDPRRSNLLHQRQQQHGSGEDSIIRFYLHKRIRRVNEREGQVYVKVSLYTNNTTNKQGTNNNNKRIDKLIAVSSTVTIADLTEIALDKFHIVPHGDNDHYRMAISTQHT